MKYSILIIAIDCHFSHMTRFVCNLKQENPEVEIHYLTEKTRTDIPDDIVNNVDEIIHFKVSNGKGGYFGVFKKIVSLNKQFKNLSRNNKYDIVNVHFPHYYMAFTMRYLRKMTKNVVVSPWGSDVLRVDGLLFKILIDGVFRKCDYITTVEDGNIRKKLLAYLPNSINKFRSMMWGSETIDYITHHIDEIDTEVAKERFGLAGKYVITCGYNAFRAQNHDKIIDAIVQIKSQLPNNLKLLFPVSYGEQKKDRYVAELRERCQKEQLDALFVENYMSVPDVFLLRLATDIFIHVQNTDAGCSTVQEYLLCYKKVVHGSWIHYQKLEAYPPLCFYPASDFSVLGDVVLDAYRSNGIKVANEVFEYIRHNGWEERRKEWNDMFEKIATSNKW